MEDDMDLTLEELQGELNRAIADMSESENLAERVQLSEIIKNLSASLGVFFSFASDMMLNEMTEQEEGNFSEDDYYDD